jgi:glycosyltransferase involved in cell wall biosynthesis
MENNLTIIIPAYNEEESLKRFLPQLIEFCKTNSFYLVVVNDGSTDNSKNIISAIFKEYSFVRLINHKVNKGYGGAIKTGINASQTKYLITIDADGQHLLDDVEKLYKLILEKDADMIVGSRKGQKEASLFRKLGKNSIRFIAKILMPLNINDINSGMKIYNTELAKKYISLCPDSMPYSDIILLTFVYQKHLVLEEPISIKPRVAGKSTISVSTAFETIKEIMNIVVLFNPLRIFFPIAFFCISFGILWGLPFILLGRGVSNGAIITILSGIIFFTLGLIAEQLSMIRKKDIND